ncbi:MAG: DinB family protein [Ignavibacteriae bacterium]|nr:DinB family protein [Ignavibacteriota bacterium]
MKRSEIEFMPDYFDKYINEVDDIEIIDALNKYGTELLKSYRQQLINTGNKIYAENKWTVKEILQHLIDCERIFCYRALAFAREDKTNLPGFAENEYAEVSDPDGRSIDDLISDFDASRNSTIKMFESFNDKMLMNHGICNNTKISVLAIGFVIAGHTLHHMKVLHSKYFSL